MYVCICRQVRSADITTAVERGATRLQDVSRLLGVGQQCGMCARYARELIDSLRNEHPTPGPTASVSAA